MNRSETDQLLDILQDVRQKLSRIHHDINNPLSIISGNVQLIQELSRALEVQEEFSGPLEDIHTAVDQLTDSIDRLMTVRNILAEKIETEL
jgi:signal transduction histidine kinase